MMKKGKKKIMMMMMMTFEFEFGRDVNYVPFLPRNIRYSLILHMYVKFGNFRYILFCRIIRVCRVESYILLQALNMQNLTVLQTKKIRAYMYVPYVPIYLPMHCIAFVVWFIFRFLLYWTDFPPVFFSRLKIYICRNRNVHKSSNV